MWVSKFLLPIVSGVGKAIEKHALVAFFALLIMTLGAGFLLVQDDVEFTPLRISIVQSNIVGRGYYKDWACDTDPYLATENVALAVHHDGRISGTTKGDYRECGTIVHAETTALGYKKGDNLYVAFYTRSKNGDSVLVGDYVLRQHDRFYSGFITFYDGSQSNPRTLRCPYVLATDANQQTLSDDDAEARWPLLRSDCLPIVLP